MRRALLLAGHMLCIALIVVILILGALLSLTDRRRR